jgi:flagellin-like protein
MEDMRKLVRNKKGVSEIVGTILLLGMAIALFVGVHIVALNVIPFSPNAPSVRINGDIKNDLVYLQHNGGDSLPLNTKVIFSNDITGESIAEVQLSNFKFNNSDVDPIGVWNIGEIISYSNPNFINIKIQLIIIDIDSNAIIAQDIFQEVN